MNCLIFQLLPSFGSGDFLRLAASRENGSMLRIEIEGGGTNNASLRHTLGAVLKGSRHKGVEFEEVPVDEDSASASRGIDYHEIAPRSVALPVSSAVVGFSGGSAARDAEITASALVPQFLPNSWAQVGSNPLVLPFAMEAVERVEIEFRPCRITNGQREALDRIRSALCRSLAVSGDFGALAFNRGETDRFLHAWRHCDCGNEVRMRVGLQEELDRAGEAFLELCGRSLFGTQCEIARRSATARRAEGLDLSRHFPDGWRFPEFVSLDDEAFPVAARRSYHSHSPRLPIGGAMIGKVDQAEVRLPDSTRDRHTYIAGATGTGKSTLLKRLIREDLHQGRSVVLIDPHGDLFADVLETLPEERWDDLFVIDPSSEMTPPGFNFLELPRDRFFDRRAEFLIGELLRFFQETWHISEAFGPMFEIYYRNAMLLLLQQEKVPVTAMDFERVFTDAEFRKTLLSLNPSEQVKRFWSEIAAKVSGDAALANVTPYITSKMSVFTSGGFLTEMISQAEDEVRLEDRINGGCVLLVNLDKGLLGPHQSRLLGTLLTMQIFAAGLKRSSLPPAERRPVHLYIDEFQNFVSENVSAMLSEARKFGLRLHLANQTLSQLSSPHAPGSLLESVLGNVGNLLLFRLGVPDANRLVSYFEPFSRQQMLELRNYHALARLLTDEGPLRPFIFETLP